LIDWVVFFNIVPVVNTMWVAFFNFVPVVIMTWVVFFNFVPLMFLVHNLGWRLPLPTLSGPDYSMLSRNSVRFDVFVAVTMKNGVLWDVTPCGCCKNPRFGAT
jgi:hypothetical protein